MNDLRDPPPPIDNRITRILGMDYPILQAPMGWIARSQLASAVCEAGGLGIIETSSGEIDIVKEEILRMGSLTQRPFGVNIPKLFMRDESIVDFLAEAGVTFVTTSAGDPALLCKRLKDAGITVFHVVPTLNAALKAEDAGVDGLIVEGGEGGGFKGTEPVSTMVLLPLVRSRTKLPIIGAGGICDGISMAAAFILGAEGVQMGTRMVGAAESPVHDNWKQAILDADETGTALLNRLGKPSVRAIRTAHAQQLERLEEFSVMNEFTRAKDLYFGGDMNASIALAGQVVGRIGSIQSARYIVHETIRGFYACLEETSQFVKGRS
jgi:enoyl-[acyl-carrier protein] reductase II